MTRYGVLPRERNVHVGGRVDGSVKGRLPRSLVNPPEPSEEMVMAFPL